MRKFFAERFPIQIGKEDIIRNCEIYGVLFNERLDGHHSKLGNFSGGNSIVYACFSLFDEAVNVNDSFISTACIEKVSV